MRGISEFAGNLKAELLDVAADVEEGKISTGEAYRRIRTIRRRRLSGVAEYQRKVPQVSAGVLQAQP